MTLTAFTGIFAAALTASMLYVILRLFPKYKVYNLHALTINYVTASLSSLIASGDISVINQEQIQASLLPAMIIGSLFISVFYAAALSTQLCGVTVTSVAGKMSMIIPISAAIWLFGDQLTVLKIVGIAIALLAVYFSTPKNGGDVARSKFWFLPLIVFLGSGLVDTSVKMAQHYFIRAENQQLFISMLFGSAAVIGIIFSVGNYYKNKIALTKESILGGIILGIVNYFSLYFLVKCLAVEGMESSLVFSITNLLVVIISALVAFLFFKEKTDARRVTGLALAVLAIIILYF